MSLSIQSYPKFKSIIPSTNQPNNGGLVYTYITGTTTKQNTYADAQGNTVNANPIILDSNGEWPIWILNTDDAAYDFVIKDANNNLLQTITDIQQVAIINNLTPALGDLSINNYSIIDANNKKYEQFTSTSNSANWLTITNSATGYGPTIGTAGADANIDYNLTTKGASSKVNMPGNVTIGALTATGTTTGTLTSTGTTVLHGLTYPSADGVSGSLMYTDGAGHLALGTLSLLVPQVVLTGDATGSEDGSGFVATTLATVNSNVGAFTNANITVNSKGLITAAANGSGGGGINGLSFGLVFDDPSGGGSPTVLNSYNVTSIICNSAGLYTITLSNPIGAYAAITGSCIGPGGASENDSMYISQTSTTSVVISCRVTAGQMTTINRASLIAFG